MSGMSVEEPQFAYRDDEARQQDDGIRILRYILDQQVAQYLKTIFKLVCYVIGENRFVEISGHMCPLVVETVVVRCVIENSDIPEPEEYKEQDKACHELK